MESNPAFAVGTVVLLLLSIVVSMKIMMRFSDSGEKMTLERLVEEAAAGKDGKMRLDVPEGFNVCRAFGFRPGCFGGVGVVPGCWVEEGSYLVKARGMEGGVCLNFTVI